eukprot:568035-Amorphochlora_amoeboformis.AAC.1
MHEKTKTEQVETHRAALKKAREDYNNRITAARKEIESKRTSEIAKKDELLELERKTKDQLDSKLRNLEFKLLAAVKSEEKAEASKENNLEGKYRQTVTDLMDRVNLLIDENGDLKAKLSASRQSHKVAVNEAEKEVEELRREVKQVRGLLLANQSEAERAKK